VEERRRPWTARLRRRCRITTTWVEFPRFFLQRFPDRSNRMLALADVKTVARFHL